MTTTIGDLNKLLTRIEVHRLSLDTSLPTRAVLYDVNAALRDHRELLVEKECEDTPGLKEATKLICDRTNLGKINSLELARELVAAIDRASQPESRSSMVGASIVKKYRDNDGDTWEYRDGKWGYFSETRTWESIAESIELIEFNNCAPFVEVRS